MRFTLMLQLAGAALLAACAGAEFKGEKDAVRSMKSVAVVAFSVPMHVASAETGSGAAASAIASLARGGMRGNGETVAREALPGFIDGLSKGTGLAFVEMGRVTGSTDFQALRQSYDQSKRGQGAQRAAVPGLPVIVLARSAERSEFAAKAAQALAVDGVVLVDVNQLQYVLYTGAMGSGQAKAKASALFKVYDRSGRAVWEAASVVFSEASAGMVSGGINPAAAPQLHRSVGATIANDLVKTFGR